MFKFQHSPDFAHSEAPILDTLTTGASPKALTLAAYETVITTGGTAGNESVTIPDGTYVGQRKKVTLGTRTHASDVVVLPHANMTSLAYGNQTEKACTAATLAAAGKFVLLEWSGTKWMVLFKDASTLTFAA